MLAFEEAEKLVSKTRSNASGPREKLGEEGISQDPCVSNKPKMESKRVSWRRKRRKRRRQKDRGGRTKRRLVPDLYYSVSKLVHRLIRFEFPPRILWIMRVTRSSDRGGGGGGRMVRVSREQGTLFESGLGLKGVARNAAVKREIRKQGEEETKSLETIKPFLRLPRDQIGLIV